MVVVVGATGSLGLSICQELVRAGRPLRAVVRPSSDPGRVEALRSLGADLVQADLKDPASLARACAGMETVITSATTTLRDPTADSIPEVDHQGTLDLVRAAQDAGVKQVVYISFPTALDGLSPSPLSRAKRAVEGALRDSGLTCTLLQAACFMEVWLSPQLGFDYPQARARVLGSGETPIGWISLHDVARCVAGCVEDPVRFGGDLVVVAENLSMHGAVRVFEEVGGRPFALEHVPLEALEGQLAAARTPLEHSFAALMLGLAQGAPLAADARMGALCPAPSMVRDYARSVMVAGVSA